MKDIVSSEAIEEKRLRVRGQKVMLDKDLAELYGVETGHLNRAVSRNMESFPEDFMFQLRPSEYNSLRCHFGILKRGAHSKYLPRVFTEQGVAMLSSVLKSRRARQVNIAIMRAFVRLRALLATHKDLARRLDELEQRYDAQFRSVFDAIRALMEPSGQDAKRIEGFKPAR